MKRLIVNSAEGVQVEVPVVPWSDGRFVEWFEEGESGPQGWQQISAAQAAALLAPKHQDMVTATLKKARALRPPIMSILDGMQASALVNATLITVNQQQVPLASVIEGCKQALKDLPQQVDLSQCTTQQQMEAVVLQAYLAIVAAAPPEIKSAFDSLKP